MTLHQLLPSPAPIDVNAFLQRTLARYDTIEHQLIRNAVTLAQIAGEQHITPSGTSCLHQGFDIADILAPLAPDATGLAAAIVYPVVHYAGIELDDITEQLSSEVAALISGILQMNELRFLQTLTTDQEQNRRHMENIRRMLVTMVEDARVVLIVLAERVYSLKMAASLSVEKKRALANETMNVYAPLANRLGVSQIKWQLEDLSFQQLETETYQNIANSLASSRDEHEQLIKDAIALLSKTLNDNDVHDFEISGRAKHIYSIYRKMQRKKVGIEEIYDVLAVRVLTQNIEDCYATLSHVHALWPQIPKEFDDYIATPKPNGYQSIHTAVIGPGHKSLEVQIRTIDMHKHSELGVAAHWYYKQGGKKPSREGKIAWLRQVLEWEKELSQHRGINQDPLDIDNSDDRIYVFTPVGEIKDLPRGSTPLDFAYQVHSEVGHRCRGAKVNGSIVQLTYKLKTGEQVEILTTKHPQPSRDWLNPQLGYLNSPRSRAKVLHWFKQQDHSQHVSDGQHLIKTELHKLGLDDFDLNLIVKRLHLKALDDLFAAVGCGDLRIVQLVSMIQAKLQQLAPPPLPPSTPTRLPETQHRGDDVYIEGVGNLLTHIARCCQPLPGDAIIGFITRGRGVSIHSQDCSNILQASAENQKRLINVSWGLKPREHYPVDVCIDAFDRHGLIRDVTALLSIEKINVLSLITTTNKNENTARIQLTVEINDLSQLSTLFSKISKISHVTQVQRETKRNH